MQKRGLYGLSLEAPLFFECCCFWSHPRCGPRPNCRAKGWARPEHGIALSSEDVRRCPMKVQAKRCGGATSSRMQP